MAEGATQRRTIAIFLSVCIALAVLAASCSGASAYQSFPTEAQSHSDPRQYVQSTIGSLTLAATIDVPAARRATLVVGDVSGGAAEEIILAEGDRTRVFDADGTLLLEFSHPGESLAAAFVTDVTGDGKGDIVYGAFDAGATVVEIYDGRGNQIASERIDAMAGAETIPLFASEGRVYFTAASRHNIPPRMVGSIDPSGRTGSWVYHLGPYPTGLSMGTGGSIAVSNRGIAHERRPLATPPATERDRNALLVVNSDGEQLYRPIGPPARDGHRVPDGVSQLVSRLCDVDGDGADELLVLIERISELYDGPAEFMVVSADGSVRARIEGPRATEGSFGFYRSGQEVRIVLAWSRTGAVLLLDKDLRVLRQATIGSAPHALRFRQTGDFSGDGRAEFIVSDGRTLFILDETLAVRFSRPVRSTIRAVEPVRPADGRVRFAVLSDRLYLFAPGAGVGTLEVYTNPPGATILIDGEQVEPASLPLAGEVAPGRRTVEARLGTSSVQRVVDVVSGRNHQVEIDLPQEPARADSSGKGADPLAAPGVPVVPLADYGRFTVTASAAIPHGYFVRTVDDFLASPGLEVLLESWIEPSYLLLDASLEVLRSGRMPVETTGIVTTTDIDGDGYADIVPRIGAPTPSFMAMNGDGRYLVRKPFMRATDTGILLLTQSNGSAFFAAITGYLLHPRGAYAVRRPDWEIEYFYPTASMVNSAVHRDGWLYLGCYTPSNGAEMVHENGHVDRDTEVFLHVVDAAGRAHPAARPMPGDDTDGGSIFFAYDSDDDGTDEVYVLLTKDDSYYQGDPNLSRFERDGSVSLVHRGVPNNAAMPTFYDSGGTRWLSLQWYRTPTVHEILRGADFELTYRQRYAAGEYFVSMVNLDADDEWEILEVAAGALRVVDLSRRTLAVYEVPGASILNAFVRDISGNGKSEIVAYSRDTVHVLSY